MTSNDMETDTHSTLLPPQAASQMPATSNRTSARKPPRRPQQQSSQRKDFTRFPVAPRPPTQDATKARRPPPTARRGPDRPPVSMANNPRTRTASTPKARPLLPVTERRSQEEKAPQRRPPNNSDSEKWDITPEGSSAGREGRQFTVANVGNNGRIYLRPTVRPAHQRYPQPHFVFPLTPPQTAGIGAAGYDKGKRAETLDTSQPQSPEWTPSQVPSPPTTQALSYLLDDRKMSIPGHRRALSDSTIHESSVARESDPGGFKIVITQPGEEHRPKTLEDIDIKNPPFLEIPIPSWKLGTPRWSVKGTPLIQGSSYAPTEEFRSSNHSLLRSGGFTPRFRSSVASRKPGSIIVPPVRLSASQKPALSPGHALPSPFMSDHIVIEPAMFDALTFKPACDDRAIVRYSASTGAVTAATPPRLVAEITSPCFLDYELLSDFFLTFRSFLAALDLLKMLFARLRWALVRYDEIGMVVRVRTFVALRHWILNYFVDDFVCEYEMRSIFCNLLNSLTDDVSSQDSKARRVQLKILAELKKCWRRVCAQFWDGPEFDASLPPEAPIAPGGIPGHRNPSLDPEFWKKYLNDGPPQLDNILAPLTSNPPDAETSFLRVVAEAGQDEPNLALERRPGTPENQIGKITVEEGHISPTSIASADVVSCSFPTKSLKLSPASSQPLAAHPVDPSPMYNNVEPIATTPRALLGKRLRPQQAHKRNNSQSDSLREHNTTLEQLLQKNTETLLSLPYAGSLVRGNVLPPGQAFVEVLSPASGYGPSRQTTIFQPYPDESQEKCTASAMSGQGMRKLIGSVRRALSTRGQDVSPTQGNFNISPIGPRGVTTNRLPGTAIVPQSRPKPNGSKPPVRVDLLGAEAVEDFKKVIREDAAARSFHGSIPSTPTTVGAPGEKADYSAARMQSLLQVPQDGNTRPSGEGALTTGSNSILIFDDLLRVPNEFPAMTGALPVFNPSVEAISESFPPQGADPTPPTTPPGRTSDTPRRSSYLLGQQMLRTAKSADEVTARTLSTLPAFVPDLNSLRRESDPPPSDDMDRPSVDVRRPSPDLYRQSVSRPPLSGVRNHNRHRSSRSLRSNGTMGPRRYASFHSGMALRSNRSFDATTCSDQDCVDHSPGGPVPQPLRVLRRRPGGDLRAVDNVVDLGPAVLHRSHSTGSLTTYTDSLCTSFIQSPAVTRESTGLVDVVNSDYSRDRPEAFSLGAIAAKPKRKISLLSTSSSKPIMRPSFELEAQKLANIPDDDDDGGVESALLKLEGKYEKKTFRVSMEPTNAPPHTADSPANESPPLRDDPCKKIEKKKHRQEQIGGEGVIPVAPFAANTPTLSHYSFVDVPENVRTLHDEVGSLLSDGSNESYSSIPLLQRGLTDDGRRSRAEWTNRSIHQGPEDDGPTTADEKKDEEQHRSYEFVKKSESLEKIKPGDTMPTRERSNTRDSNQSFLNSDSDSDDDELSSDLSETPKGDEEDADGFLDVGINAADARVQTADTQSAQAQAAGSEPSPPLTMAQALAMSPETANIPELHSTQIWSSKPLPPTPQYTPTYGQSGPDLKSTPDPTGANEALRNAANIIEQEQEAAARKYCAHLPFILAFDSEILAQQFTLIEKDALNEIDWKELIEMHWKNAENNDCRSWVHFLRESDARGVEVVIARFNIVVKWAVSEIVLTQDPEERARCIIKYIHIAVHCRRYRNFATMSQIAVALTSSEVSRLSKTWRMVPPHDLRTLRELEGLISPTRNFYALRAEMEGGGIATADMGCIPFVGIYTHDLIFNAQRPSEIASSPAAAPLVNFERCRIAASVVKTLLRLLEASTLYDFQPIEGITERCLWMSALTDEEIRRHSSGLE